MMSVLQMCYTNTHMLNNQSKRGQLRLLLGFVTPSDFLKRYLNQLHCMNFEGLSSFFVLMQLTPIQY